ncbi:MliC family protein [Xanthobacter sp. DSM 24535]|uniref:MliC family protein n=1 Tax=Roseixanthobacter psychrophilus TaxID=3119917 RepID=UPI00372B360E
MKAAPILAVTLAIAMSSGSAAQAVELTLTLPGDAPAQRLTTTYECPGLGTLSAEYVDAGDVSLAILPVEGKSLIFANVLSASGARYASGPFIWWIKGQTAALYDLRKGEDAAPQNCRER